jgi:tetratricopeptide (TPR) repeat protein
MGLLEGEEAPVAFEETLQAELPEAHAPKLRPDVDESAPEVNAKPVADSTEPALDDETQKFIAQSLTDVDLFASYGLTQKAIGLLEAILRRAPRHTPTLEKLLDFVLGAGDDRRTAELAAQLEQIHQQRGDSRSSERFGELRRRFQRAAGLSDEELFGAPAATAAVQEAAAPAEAQEFSVPEVSATAAVPAEEKLAPPPEEITASQPEPASVDEVHEVDLSDEWASMLHEKPAATEPAVHPSSAQPPEAFEVPVEPGELEEFSISEEPAHNPPAHAEPAGFDEFEVAPAAPPAAGAAPPPPKLTPAPHVEEISLEEISSPKPEPVRPATKTPAPPAKPQAPKAPEPEFELDQDYELVLEQESLVPAYDQKPPEKPIVPLEKNPEPVAKNSAPAAPSGSGFASDQFLADLANEIDQLGIGDLAPGFSGSTPQAEASSRPAPANVPAPAGESGPLKEVFDEFRAELGEMGAEDEDLETHYNLGIAFREMGLLEEAISEFQKVAKANDQGRAFRYSMQCCTLLGLAFMEKGQPSIAAIWYERALLTKGMDPESILALRYDLGVAQESAGEPAAALKSFSQVYAMNIDYRDVAERIAALQKPAR